MSQPYEPVQHSSPIYLNSVQTITEYAPPTSETDQRPEPHYVPLPKHSKPDVPKIPEMDRVPQDIIFSSDGLDSSERQKVFLVNGAPNSPHAMHLQNEPLDGTRDIGEGKLSGVSTLFFGSLSLVGLILVYRAMKHYT